MTTAIVWFRRDLRLSDHPALDAARRAGHRIVGLYVHAPHEESPWRPGAASCWWLHHSLASLRARLRSLGGELVLRAGDSLVEIERVAEECQAEAIYWSRLYEPALVERDATIKRALRRRGLHAESHNAALLVEPWQVATGQGDPYKVFTPFWNKARERIQASAPSSSPGIWPSPPSLPPSRSLDSLGLLPRVAWDGGLREHWQPGEAGAGKALEAFVGQALLDYRRRRDHPDRDGTSRLSPHLHFGEISPRQVWHAIERAARADPRLRGDADGYLRELGWREFSHHLLYHFPDTSERPLNPRFASLAWQRDPAPLAAWQRGRTGIPIVDAGMRQLWHTGWMHNRVRMLVASLLVKNLGQHWLEGARWFWDTLVDADLANNTQGWQWAAGCGADAAPYVRIFNPVLQGGRFDRQGDYVAAWVPELAGLPARWRQQPWLAPEEAVRVAGLGPASVYRKPLVDLAESRRRALAAYETIRVAGAGGRSG